MGQSDLIILAVSLLGFAFIGYFLFSLTKQKGGRDLNNDEDDGRGGDQHRPRGNLRRRRGGGVANNEDEDDEDNQDEEEEDERDLGGMTKKEIAKIEKRRAKTQQREAMEAERGERKEKEEERMSVLREREAEKDEEFRVREEERVRVVVEEERRRQEAYNHWRDPVPDHILHFPPPLSSSATAATAGSKDLQGGGRNTSKSCEGGGAGVGEEAFAAFIKESKSTSLDELSMHFDLPTYNCIAILKHLVKKGVIAGVFVGDGSQFLCVDERTVGSVAAFVGEQGTLSMTDVLKIVQ